MRRKKNGNSLLTYALIILSVIIWLAIVYQFIFHSDTSRPKLIHDRTEVDDTARHPCVFQVPDSFYYLIPSFRDPFSPVTRSFTESKQQSAAVDSPDVEYEGFVTDGNKIKALFRMSADRSVFAEVGQRIGNYRITQIDPEFSVVEFQGTLFKIAIRDQ